MACGLSRNFELCQLQERDLTPGARGPALYYLPFIGVFLDNRKGWQQKQGYDGPLASMSLPAPPYTLAHNALAQAIITIFMSS
ncbi:hypothetical protein B0H13DRAFT_1616177 [Mycena leptocephala]|nr:hypothetical protein B0H13DRAFT_1616177 [Mycena leptocephala]